MIDTDKSYPFTDAVKAIVTPYWSDEEEDEDDGEVSEREENFDDETYGSLGNINIDDYVLQPPPPVSNTEWPDHLQHFSHLGGVAHDHTTEG